MSHAWTNKVNCVEECIGDTRQASIFLEGAWIGHTNDLQLAPYEGHLNPSLVLEHINTMLDVYGALSIVVLWYFNEISPVDIESTINVRVEGISVLGDGGINIIETGNSVIDNVFVQTWATFNKAPGETISWLTLSFANTIYGIAPYSYSGYPGAFVDVRLYVGGYTPFLVRSEQFSDPNMRAGFAQEVSGTELVLNPLLEWAF